MNIFNVNGTDFGIGKVICEIEDGIIKHLEITGDENVVKSMFEEDDEDSEWSWILYPPKVSFHKIPFEQKGDKIEIEITDELSDEYDITFYLTEHHNIYGTLIIDGNHIGIKGEVRNYMSDEKLYSLEVAAEKH
jgi:hypothetical protein